MKDNLFSCFIAQPLEGTKEAGYLGSLGYLTTPTLLMLLLSWQRRAPQECQTGSYTPQLIPQPPTGRAWGPPRCGNPRSFPQMDNVCSSVFTLLGFAILPQKKLTKYKSCLRKSTVLFFISPEFMEELKNSRANIHIPTLSQSKMGSPGPRRCL